MGKLIAVLAAGEGRCETQEKCKVKKQTQKGLATESTECLKQGVLCDLCDLCGNTFLHGRDLAVFLGAKPSKFSAAKSRFQ